MTRRRRLAPTVVGLGLVVVTGIGPAAAAAPARPWDFDGDGRPELAVGAPTATVGGVPGAGTVDIAPGAATGPDPVRGSTLSLATPGVPGTPVQGDGFGAAVASGDLNGDGYADLVVGAPGATVRGRERAGTVRVLYGSATGLSSTSSAPTVLSPGVDGLPAVPDEKGGFGSTLAVADLTGDGIADLAAGLPGDLAVLVFPGSRSGISAGRVQVVHSPQPDPEDDTVLVGFGAHVAAGDTDADGRADLAVTDVAYGEETRAGQVQVFAGTATGVAATPVTVDGQPDGTAGVLALGDLDGNGRADLAFADSGEDTLGGGVSVALATANGFGPATLLSQSTAGVAGIDEDGDDWGQALAVARVDGDRYADLVVGAPGESLGSTADAGAVTVLFGSAAGPTGVRSRSLSQKSRGVPGAAETDDAFGASVTATDLDSDGHADLLVGAPGEDDTNGSLTLLHGSTTGVTTTGALSISARSLHAPGTEARFGFSAG